MLAPASTISVRSDRPVRERPVVELVERVRRDPHGQAERGEAPQQAIDVQLRSDRRAEREVAQMPGRVGRVQERQHVPQATAAERVEGRAAQRRGVGKACRSSCRGSMDAGLRRTLRRHGAPRRPWSPT